MPDGKSELIFNTLEDLGILVGDTIFSSEGFRDACGETFPMLSCSQCGLIFTNPAEIETLMRLVNLHTTMVCLSGFVSLHNNPSSSSIVQNADSDIRMDSDYIYIYWNGLNCGKYNESSVFFFSPVLNLELGIIQLDTGRMDLIEKLKSDITTNALFNYNRTYNMSVNCPDGVQGNCWHLTPFQSHPYNVRDTNAMRTNWSANGFAWLQQLSNCRDFLHNLSQTTMPESDGNDNYHAYKIPISSISSPQIRALNYSKRGIQL